VNRAQAAFALLAAVLLAGAVVLFCFHHSAPAWTMLVAGLVGYLALLGMITSQTAERK
jgi:hypothetical protein